MLLKKSGTDGFTLIELLVVIAVIAGLLAVILPSLAAAKEQARRVVCGKNVSQFIVGILLYADGYNKKLPSGQSESGMDEHIPVITRKTGNRLVEILGSHKMLKCPWLGKPFDGQKGWYYPGYGYVLGYNYLGGHGGTPWLDYQAPKKWISPKTTAEKPQLPLITEINCWSSDNRTFAPHGKHGPINKYHEPGTGGMRPDKAGAIGGNIGLLDGSVAWKKIRDMNIYKGSRQNGCYAMW